MEEETVNHIVNCGCDEEMTPVCINDIDKTSRFLAVLIDKVADKHDMEKSIAANHIRTKLSFEIIKSQVLCIRGSRSLRKSFVDVAEVEVVQHVAGIRES